MRWVSLVKNILGFFLVFAVVFWAGNKIVFGSYELPYIPGGYTQTEIVANCPGGNCGVLTPGQVYSFASSYAPGQIYSGFYEAPNHMFYPIGGPPDPIYNISGGGGGGSGPADNGTGACTGVYSSCFPWRECSTTCGPGTQPRTCFDTGCGASQEQSQACQVNDPNVWGAWSGCTGTQVSETRTNQCGTPESRSCPSAPNGTCGSFNSDPVNPATPITYTWAVGTGLQVWDSTGYWWYNNPASSPTSFSGIVPGRTVYARTMDFNGFSITGSTICPLPANPPAATIGGKLQQKSGTGCYETSAGNSINVTSLSTTTNSTCVSSSCTATDHINYTCTVSFDSNSCLSQTPPTWPNSANVTLGSAVAPGYGFIGWTTPLSCSSPQNTIGVAAGSSTTRGLTLDFGANNWYKLKNSSFVGSSTASITVPAVVHQYVPGDSDDDVSKYFIIGNGGSVFGTTVNSDPPNTSYSSTSNWKETSYSTTRLFAPSSFLSYVKSRKQYTKIDNLNKITADGIYVWDDTVNFSDITNATTIPNYNFVLISTVKAITISRTNFNPAKSVAFVANSIAFSSTVQSAEGIFIAQTVDTGSNNSQGIKVKGNLIAQTTLTNGRSWSDTSRPSIFVVFDPVKYINLMPYLSTANYDWRQIQ